MFVLLPEISAIYSAWEALVTEYSISGKSSHDARLVAAMQVHGLTAILTFDKTGFSRFPGIEVVNPADVQPFDFEEPERAKAGMPSTATPPE